MLNKVVSRLFFVGIGVALTAGRLTASDYFLPDARYVEQRCEIANLLFRGVRVAVSLSKPNMSRSQMTDVFQKAAKSDLDGYDALIREFRTHNAIMAYAGSFPLIMAKDEAIAEAKRALERCSNKPASPDAREGWLTELEQGIGKVIAQTWCGNCEVLPSSSWDVALPATYNSYTLLLVPSATFSKADKANVEQLEAAFKAFGEAIGRKEAAVWLQDPKRLGIDKLRSKDYCDKFRLSYNNGPYLVLTRKRPDLAQAAEKPIVIRFTGFPIERIIHVMNVLEQDLRRRHYPSQGEMLLAEISEWLASAFADNAEALKDVVLSVVK
jgi:hypothetical protein